MKSGISLVDMAKEIQRQADLKADYMLDTRSLRLEPFDSKLYLNAYDQSGVPALEPLEVNSIAHRQIGTHLKIPAAYYDKMLEKYPQLLAQNVNAWFQREPSVRMIRTIEGTARAFLSNRYRRIDNLDIASIVLPVLQDMEGMHFESCQLTESRMYIKVVNTRLEAEVVPGDIVQSGIIISNSEVGLGSVNIQPLVYRLVCSNGMVVNDAQTRRTHVGRVNEASENYQLYSEKTLEADDKAFAMKIQDTVRAVVDEVRFTRVVNMMREAKEARMNTTDVPGIVKLVSRDFHITDEESSGVLQRLIEGNDLTLYGLSNAVTRHSQDVQDYIIKVADILRIFALNQKVYIQTANAEFLIKYRLYEIEDVLRKQKFLRISNSEIVNIRKIADIDLSIIGRVCIRLSGDICVYVSRRYIPKIKKSLGI